MLHTDFPEVTRIIHVKADSEMKRATSAILTSWMLSVLVNAAAAHMAPMFPGLSRSG